MKTTTLIAFMILFANALNAQTHVVSGTLTVFDAFPVQNVEVSSKHAKATTMTDSLGRFDLVCMENDVVKVNPKAFKPLRKKVDATTEHLNIDLQFIDTKENREIAIGYGYIEEKNLTFGISHMDDQSHDFCSYSTIFELIKGQFSGVSVYGDRVFVRGGKNSFSMAATEVLYVVDDHAISDIAWIQPCQVSSIDVLKDSNAAIYGTRGGNGVVLIEMKK